MTSREVSLNHNTIWSQHTSVMNAESLAKQHFQLCVPRFGNLPKVHSSNPIKNPYLISRLLQRSTALLPKCGEQFTVRLCHVPHRHRQLARRVTRVHEA